MSKYAYHLHKDFKGIPAQDKETVMDLIEDGPKTTNQISFMTGMDPVYTRNIVKHLDTIGVVCKIGRRGPSILWGVKA